MRHFTSVTGLFALLFAILVGFGALNFAVTALMLRFDGAPAINEAGRLRARSQQLALAARTVDRSDAAYRAQLAEVIRATEATFDSLLSGNERTGLDPVTGDSRVQVERLQSEWGGLRGRAEELMLVTRRTPEAEQQIFQLQMRSDAFLQSADQVVRDLVRTNQQQVATARRDILTANMALGAGAFVASGLAWYLSWRLVFLPVGRLTALTQAFAAGKLDRRFGPRYTPGEIGRLGRGFDAMAESLVRQQALERQAMSDELTGLLNRRGFMASLESIIELSERAGLAFTVCFIDVDRFKAINDSFGHAAGDQALRDLAAALTATFRRGDVVARIAGDEFAVIAVGADAVEHAWIDSGVKKALQAQQAREPRPYQLAVSVGAVSSFHGATADALLQLADEEMYAQKRARRAAAA